MESKPKLSPFYLFAVPVVALIMVLYSGLPQRVLPAVTVGDTTLKAAQLNYYYYSLYNELVEDEAWLKESGFDPDQSEAKQNYDENTTWRAWLQAQAEQRAARVIYYTDLAETAGYSYTDVEEQLSAKKAEIADFCTNNNIKVKNYFAAYYGTGMTEESFYSQYALELQAAEYRALLEAERPVEEDRIDAWLAGRHTADYVTADLELIVLHAASDRFTGAVGTEQLGWLTSKLEQLEARWLADPDSFGALYAAYTDEAAGREGVLNDATRYVLPQAVADWLYGAHSLSALAF